MSRNDPTDAAQPAPEAGIEGIEGIAGETQWISFHEFVTEVMAGTGMGEWLEEQQRLHGICSEPTCQWPIAAGRWCATCGRKLCLDHLAEHANLHARDQARDQAEQLTANARVIDDPTAW